MSVKVDIIGEANRFTVKSVSIRCSSINLGGNGCELRAGGDGDDVVDGRWHDAYCAVPGVGGEGRSREAHRESRYESQQQSEELFLTHNMHILSDVVSVPGDTGHAS